MHVHILGICGTFMGGIAAIAREAGHTVTGSDMSVYPPMSHQLEALGISLIEGFDPAQLDMGQDLIVVGNVMSRGMPIIESMLNRRLPFMSGPAWLARYVLRDRWVIAIAGTHGKTTTTSLTAWLLENAGLNPGFLVGGVPANFDATARLGTGEHFVIEADEYDTAFFDKRAKFMHYSPRTLVINNLEFDHADIYKDMSAIRWQFHQLLRLIPGSGRIIINAADAEIETLLAMGCWTPTESFSSVASVTADWHARRGHGVFQLLTSGGEVAGQSSLALPGQHNLENALAATLAAQHAGVAPDTALEGLARFKGVKRRLEFLGEFGGVRVFDDFAHHPTAIRRTLEAVRDSARKRVLAVLEPRSNTMKLGVHRDTLAASLGAADRVWAYEPEGLDWSLADTLAALPSAETCGDIEKIIVAVVAEARSGDDIIVMSNGGFGGIHERLCAALDLAS